MMTPTTGSGPLLPAGELTIGTLLAHRAEDTPDAPFVVTIAETDGGPRVETRDYAAALVLARRGSALLASLGVGAGERFGVVLRNRVEFFTCWFGAALRGAIVVPLNPDAPADEIAHALGHARCRSVVTEPDLTAAVEPAAARVGIPVVVTGPRFEELAGRTVPAPQPVDPRTPLAILYTSGTTSRPKGVVVTHANYLHAGEVVAQNLRIRPDDRWLVTLPLFHANAQYYSTMSSLVTGASLAVMPRFSASRWIVQAREHQATLGSLFAAPVRMILSHESDGLAPPERLRAVCFAQNLGIAELAEFERRTGCPLLQIYGMTETIAPATMNPLDRPRDNTTIGAPVTGATVRVVDRAGGDVPPGGVGELVIRGEPGVSVMDGYLDDPESTAAVLRDGWLHTGDLVRREHTGFLTFHDRARDVIKRSGENIAAAEVERVLDEHPAVLESAVIGVPDPIRDEAVKAVVVARPGAEPTAAEIIEHCQARLVAFKVPTVVEFVDALPRTSVGKIRKADLRRATERTGA